MNNIAACGWRAPLGIMMLATVAGMGWSGCAAWYGESVGHYEGDTLVVDTIGLNTKTYVDNYRTPHTDKLHVIERYRLINNGPTLENQIWVEDPDTFNQPWTAIQRYRKVSTGPLDEQVCA